MVFFYEKLVQFEFCIAKRPGWKRAWLFQASGFLVIEINEVWTLCVVEKAWLKRAWLFQANGFLSIEINYVWVLCCKKAWLKTCSCCYRPAVFFELTLMKFEFCVVERPGWKKAWLIQANGFLLIEINEVWVLCCRKAWLKKGLAVPGQWFSSNWN